LSDCYYPTASRVVPWFLLPMNLQVK
jgi:hypothetical protein